MKIEYTLTSDDLMQWMRWVVGRRPQIRRGRRYIPPLFAAVVVLLGYLEFDTWLSVLIALVVGSFIAWVVLPRLFDSAVDHQLRASIAGAADGVLGPHTLELNGEHLIHMTSAAEGRVLASGIREVEWSEGYAYVMLGLENGIIVPLRDDLEHSRQAFVERLESQLH